MERTTWDTRHAPPARGVARTAQQPGLILAAAWVGAVWKGAHGVSLAITEGLKAESGLVSMGLMAGNGRERQCPLVRCSAVGVRFPAGGVL